MDLSSGPLETNTLVYQQNLNQTNTQTSTLNWAICHVRKFIKNFSVTSSSQDPGVRVRVKWRSTSWKKGKHLAPCRALGSASVPCSLVLNWPQSTFTQRERTTQLTVKSEHNMKWFHLETGAQGLD